MNAATLPKSLLSTLIICRLAGGKITYAQLRETLNLSESGAKQRIRAAKRAGFLTGKADGKGQGKIAQFSLTQKAKDILP
jgi:predicted HTH transcriptional regulator